jgi:guanine deaminase
MLMLGGKVMMDRHAPPALRDTPRQGYEDTKSLIERWHGRQRLHCAITPRFAITSSEAQMEMVGALAKEFPDLHLQTHLAENRAECALACRLFPFAIDYTDIYQHYGLLGPRTLLGHCLHLSGREIAVIAESDSVAVFNPTSNLFLGSGLFDFERMRGAAVRVAVATDVGAGTSYSMLKTMDEAYKVLQLQGQKLTPIASFYLATLGNARALGLQSKIGRLQAGADADLVVLDSSATPEMALRTSIVRSLPEELFVLQTMGDDRAVVETYVAGVPVKPRHQELPVYC